MLGHFLGAYPGGKTQSDASPSKSTCVFFTVWLKYSSPQQLFHVLMLMYLNRLKWLIKGSSRAPRHQISHVYYQTCQTSPPPLNHIWALTRNSSRSWPPVHWWRKLEGLRSHSNSVNLVMGSAIQSLWSGTTLTLPHLWESNRGPLTQLCSQRAACEAQGTRLPAFNGRVALSNSKIATIWWSFLCRTLLTPTCSKKAK